QIHGGSFEQLTDDHRLWVSEDKSHLSRALGVSQQIDIDYRSLAVDVGDVFLLATDGVYEYVDARFVNDSLSNNKTNLDQAAKEIVDEALAQGSTDNLTAQIIRIDELPTQDAGEMYQQLTTLPFPPELEEGADFDGYNILRKVHSSSRSHVYLAKDLETEDQIILKVPSIDLRGDTAYLERFFMEEWVGRRLDNAHVLKSCAQTRKKNYLYIVTEYIEGTTLAQWMIDNPKPNMETVRGIVEQVAKGLRAFHRQEMLHQDLRPANIMINNEGMVKIIDFGSTQVAGLAEISTPLEQVNLLGTAQYTAPEYFLGAAGTPRSDLFSLGVITYQLLTGKLPYGAEVAKSTTRSAQNKLKYQSALHKDRAIPAWVDEVIKKAVHPNPYSRYEELTEFVYNLRRPSKEFVSKAKAPLLDRDPVLFWKGVSLCLLVVVIGLLIR
ncbi:MAG: protein kinase, partial [Cycloclasticus sp.]|nr:protein kinase [Cycloclasticus sp.]